MNNNIKNLEKYTEFFQDLKAKDIMTKEICSFTVDKKISQVKEMMRIKKISGIPIVNSKKNLVGIISIEDIITALENNSLSKKVEEFMTKEVVTININDNIADVVDKFNNFQLGRFPVVDDKNVLKGIISRVDILHGILEKFNLIYVHDTNRNSKLNQEFSSITGDLLNCDKAEFHYKIDDTDITVAGTGAAVLKQFLKGKEVDSEVARKAGIATYEAETNVVIHSKSRGDIYCFIKPDSIIIRIQDSGVGIEDLDKAMIEGFSTASDYVREFGFGAGMGIPNMKKFADKLVVISEKNVGTQVELVFFLNK